MWGGPVPLLTYVDLGFHELGHLICYVIRPPQVITAAAGSFVQVAVPVGVAVYFLAFRRDRMGAAACLAWAATSAANAAVYIADAPYERLPLIGGDHDWAFIFSDAGLGGMQRAAGLAGLVRGLGWTLLLAAAVVALWPGVLRIWQTPTRPRPSRWTARV